METLGRQVTEKQGNICYSPQMVSGGDTTIFGVGGSQTSANTYPRGLHYNHRDVDPNTQVRDEWL